METTEIIKQYSTLRKSQLVGITQTPQIVHTILDDRNEDELEIIGEEASNF
jgi:hypothetical protein